MNIIILYAIDSKTPRKTIEDSLYCFSRYDKDNRYYYLNILDTFSVDDIAGCLTEINKVSGLIIHYSALAMRGVSKWWKKNYPHLLGLIKKFKCLKIIIPQDEYTCTDSIKKIISDANIDVIYTTAYQEDFKKLYPESLGYKKIQTVYTGYVDENTLNEIKKSFNNQKREIDIGYRARQLPFWVGRHGQLKTELAQRFQEYLSTHETGLECDIKNTGSKGEDDSVFLGDDWIKYLLNCRTMLGCLGGSGLIDYDGSLRTKVEKYMEDHPDAGFAECERACFHGKDNEIHIFALSPRHFECAMTKTCQLLVEGNYDGVFVAGRDYIEIKKDFSNIADVLEQVKDKEYCEKIANQCYEDVVESGLYTYKAFVDKVLDCEGIVDKGNEYLKDIDDYCRMSHIEATREYGFLDYNLIKVGKTKTIKRWGNVKYVFARIRKIAGGIYHHLIIWYTNQIE